MVPSFIPRSAFVVAATMMAFAPNRVRAQAAPPAQPDTVRFVIEHGAKEARLEDDKSRALVDVLPNGRFRLKKPARVEVRVVNTNTALYAVSDTSGNPSTPVAPASTDPLLNFITRTKPYLPEVALAATGSPRFNNGGRSSFLRSANVPAGMESVKASAEELQTSLVELDQAMFGPRGVNQTFVMTLDALERMRGEKDHGAAALKAYRDSLGMPDPACSGTRTGSAPRLPTDSIPGRVLRTMRRLVPAVASTDATVAGSTLTDLESSFMMDVNSLRAKADTALRQADDNVSRAYRVQRLASLVANGCTVYTVKSVNVVDSARSITVKIAPRQDPELLRVAEGGSATTITVLPPRSVMRSYLGLALIVAPHASYPKYASRAQKSGGLQELYVSDTRDGRYGYGVTLGTSWRVLDFPDARWAPAVWIPEVTIGDASDSKEFGIGAGVSAHDVKLGVGWLWYRHPVLADTLTPKSLILNSGYLVMRDAYGSGTWYMSLSVFNLALFAPSPPK